MRKSFLYIFMVISLSFGVDLKISPSKELNATDIEAESFIGLVYKTKRIKIPKDIAKKAIYENRLLSNAYLKEYGIPKNTLKQKEFEIDEALSNLYVKKKQQKIDLSDEVLKSYYVSHISKFKEPQKILYYPIEFNSFKEAYSFYKSFDKNKIDSYVKSHNIKHYLVPKDKIFPPIKALFNDIHPNMVLPPIFLGNKFVVFYIKDILPSKQLPFSQVKDKIRKILLKKNFHNTKKKLLKELKN